MMEVRTTDVFDRWLARLKDRRAQVQVAARIDRLAFGHFGDVEAVGDGVEELRIHAGPGYRVYLTRRGRTLVVLLCGGDKGSQARDIARAKKLARQLEEDGA
ncbi:MAG: type II toxin-antitoxin system RelE/ParE family toxin [Alphaproteobacteria bacterium]